MFHFHFSFTPQYVCVSRWNYWSCSWLTGDKAIGKYWPHTCKHVRNKPLNIRDQSSIPLVLCAVVAKCVFALCHIIVNIKCWYLFSLWFNGTFCIIRNFCLFFIPLSVGLHCWPLWKETVIDLRGFTRVLSLYVFTFQLSGLLIGNSLREKSCSL